MPDTTNSGDAANQTLQRPITPPASRPQPFWIAALVTLAVLTTLRLYQLDGLQSEIYGDITIVYEYVAQILDGQWPTHFDLSAGPLYHYLVVPIALLTSSSYFGFKLASVLFSLGTLAFTFLLGNRLLKDEAFALLAASIAGVSSWLLIFSRLGNSQIIVPLLATASLWLAVRAAQTGGRWDFAASALISSLGLYCYPQAFILSGVVFATLFCLRLTGFPIRWRDLGLFLLVAFISALPFMWILSRTPDFFTGEGYITAKLGSGNPLGALLNNFVNAMLAFHWKGDNNSRSNPLGLPHLDWISGLLFIGGVVFWLGRDRRRLSLALFLPFVLLQIPSMLVLNVESEVPSASRTLGAAPMAYLLVASGLWWLVGRCWRRWHHQMGWILGGMLMISIMGLNLNRYFNDYIPNLPFQNTPVARLVREYVDTLPPETHIYLVGCCWNYGMPEPKSIEYEMRRPEKFHYLENAGDVICDQLLFLRQPAVLIWSDKDEVPSPLMTECVAWLPSQVFANAGGQTIFRAAPLRLDLALAPGNALPPEEEEGLVYKTIVLDGARIGVRHSPIEIGLIQDLFDGNPDSLIRGTRDNPLVVELRLPQFREARSVNVTLGAMQHFLIKLVLTYADGAVVSVVEEYRDLPPDPIVTLDIPSPGLITIARIEVTDFGPPLDGAYHIHLREIQIR